MIAPLAKSRREFRNLAMYEKLATGKAIDVSSFPRWSHYYVLDSFAEGIDYCDAIKEQWVWSIGRHRRSGLVLASLTGDLYDNPAYDCLWLR